MNDKQVLWRKPKRLGPECEITNVESCTNEEIEVGQRGFQVGSRIENGVVKVLVWFPVTKAKGRITEVSWEHVRRV